MNGHTMRHTAQTVHAGQQCVPGPVTIHTAEHLLGVSDTGLSACADVLRQAIAAGAAIYTFGNGGSATTASHLACDLTHKRSGINGNRARASFLYDLATTTAIANDHGYDEIFANPLRNFLRPGDVLVAISVSGDSPNVIKALQVGRERGATNVSLLGCDGGAARALTDVLMLTACPDPGVVESVHLAIVHELAIRANTTESQLLDDAVLLVGGACTS